MSLNPTVYSTDPDVFSFDGVKAGDAAEMESKLQALIDGSASPALIADMVLAGVEQGPGWEATLTFGAGGTTAQRNQARAIAVVAGNKTEAYEKLLARLVEANAVTQIGTVPKLEIAGGGDGSNFMALALVSEPTQ